MRWIFRAVPLLLTAYFTGEIVVFRGSGRIPSQIGWPLVYALVVVAAAWILVETRRLVAIARGGASAVEKERHHRNQRDEQHEHPSHLHEAP